MQELRYGLEAFFRGEIALEGLLAAIDRAFIDNPDSVSEFREQVQGLYNKGRLPPQLYSVFEQQIETAPRRLGAAPQRTSPPLARPTDRAFSDAPTTVSPSPWATTGHSVQSAPDLWGTGGTRARDGLTEAVGGAGGEIGIRTGPAGVGADPSGVGVTTGGTSVYPSHAQVSRSQFSGTGARSSGYSTSPRDIPAQPDEPSVGQVLNDRFELVQLLGRGGMSVVFKARDRRKVEALDRHPHVALKLLNADFKRHPESLKTLQREARKAQGLKHPNVIGIFDFDKDEHDNYFVAMELLTGSPLDQVIRQVRLVGGMEPRKAYRLIEQMGNALAAAHKQKPPIVHSDFKPSNVFLSEDGEIKVFDFGIARAARPAGGADTGEMTNFDAGILGALTPTYASPEMLARLEPDPRDDIYALAIVSYELLSGKRPFGRKTTAAEASAKRLKPSRINVLSRRQWKGLERALAFDRERRTPTVEQFLDDMRFRRSLVPLYAAAGVAALGLGLWFFVADPLLKEKRERELLVEVTTSAAARLPALVESAADLSSEPRERIYETIAGRLHEPIVDGPPVEAAAALEMVLGLPQPIRNRVYAGLGEVLVDRMLGADLEAAAAAAALTGQLPPEVADDLFAVAGDGFTAAFAAADEQGVAALIERSRVLPQEPRGVVYARSRTPILAHFSASARRAFSPDDGRYDFAQAQSILDSATVLYPDSKTIDEAKANLATVRDRELTRLTATLERLVASDRLLVSGTGDSVPDTLQKLIKLDPEHYPDAAGHLVRRYREQARAAKGRRDFSAARGYLDVALTFFPENAQLRRERDSLALSQAQKPSEPGAAAIRDHARRRPPDPEAVGDAREQAQPPQGQADRDRAEQEHELKERGERERQARNAEDEPGEKQTTALQYWRLIADTSDVAVMRGFLEGFPGDPVLTALARKRVRELEDWDLIKASDDVTKVESFLARYPDDPVLTPLAERRMREVQEVAPTQQRMAVGDAGVYGDDDAAERALERAAEIPPHMIQQALKDLGFLKGAADGVVGPGTRRAVRVYQRSRGAKQTGKLDDRQIVALIVQAAEAGHARSQNTLGMMAAEGVGVVQDLSEALRWFESAAEQGDAYAAFNLGVLYRDGRGVASAISQAREYFQSARAGGHPQAAKALAELDR